MQTEERPYLVDGISYGEEDVIAFESGMPGFPLATRFIISSRPEHAPFHWLHGVGGEDLRFILINPLQFEPDYSPDIRKQDLVALGVDRREDLLLYVIVTLGVDIAQSTANLSGPILINIRRRLGKQVILDDKRFPVKAPILKG